MTSRSWKALLIDIDGVLIVGSDPIAGAREALHELRASGVPFRLVTNNASRSRRLVVQRLVKLGFEIADADVVTPARLAVQYCAARYYERVALHVNPAMLEDLGELDGLPDGDVQAVILGDLGPRFTYARMNRIYRQMDAGAELVALHRNRVWQRKDGLMLNAGPFIAALEYATGAQATVIGKPSETFFEESVRDLGVDAHAAVMVGDDIEADVGGALNAGLDGVLVKTGKFRPDTAWASDVKPTLVIDSIVDLAAFL
jgi:HAD superfamily hydrolase (TIGR01458 family)